MCKNDHLFGGLTANWAKRLEAAPLGMGRYGSRMKDWLQILFTIKITELYESRALKFPIWAKLQLFSQNRTVHPARTAKWNIYIYKYMDW